MLLVKTKIGPSEINGTGLFADQFITKGTRVWKFQPGFDLSMDKEEFKVLSEPAKEQFLKYSYVNPKTNKINLDFDNARFWNHSDDPNCLEDPTSGDEELPFVAVRDIQKGQELTCNYKDFDADFDYKMTIQ